VNTESPDNPWQRFDFFDKLGQRKPVWLLKVPCDPAGLGAARFNRGGHSDFSFDAKGRAILESQRTIIGTETIRLRLLEEHDGTLFPQANPGVP
jgi:hypothetical protein